MTIPRLIPLFNPVRTVEMERAAIEVIRSGHTAMGPLVDQFEREFGKLIGCDYVVATNDMTSALVLALRLSGVRPGDYVATLAFSCLSTNSAISIIGAKPVWVDVDPNTMSMCSKDLEHKYSSKIKAVLLYHVAGYPADVENIDMVCKTYGIPLIEDCNNAIGAEINGRAVGQMGKFAVYSFYPNRQINGFEGGALVCSSKDEEEHAKKLRRFGIDLSKFRDDRGEINADLDVPEIGISASFNQLNAAVAITQLKTFSIRLENTKRNAGILRSSLEGVRGIKVVDCIMPGASPAYWCLLIHAKRRDNLLSALKRKGISCSTLHFRNDAYTGFQSQEFSLPGTEYAMANLLAIPCGWWLSEDDIFSIVTAIIEEV